MLWQIRELDVHQIRFYMLDDTVAHLRRQQVDNRRVNRGGRGKGPAFASFPVHYLRDVVGQLPENPAIVLRLEALAFRDAIHMTATPTCAAAIADRKTSSLIR